MRLVLEAQHQHRQRLERERPDHPERIRLTQRVRVAARTDDCQELQDDYQINHPIRRAVFPMRSAKPIGEHAVF